VEDSDFWIDFAIGNSNKLQKLGLEGKQLSPQCVHTWANNIGYTSGVFIFTTYHTCLKKKKSIVRVPSNAPN